MSLNKPMRDGRVSGTAHRHVYGWKGWLVFTGPVGQWLGQRRAARLVSFLMRIGSVWIYILNGSCCCVSQASSQSGQPLKFTTSDSCDRIKDEFQFLQAQYHRYATNNIWDIATEFIVMTGTIDFGVLALFEAAFLPVDTARVELSFGHFPGVWRLIRRIQVCSCADMSKKLLVKCINAFLTQQIQILWEDQCHCHVFYILNMKPEPADDHLPWQNRYTLIHVSPSKLTSFNISVLSLQFEVGVW